MSGERLHRVPDHLLSSPERGRVVVPVSVNTRLVGDVISLGLQPPDHGVLRPEQNVDGSGSSGLPGPVVGDFVSSSVGRRQSIVGVGP